MKKTLCFILPVMMIDCSTIDTIDVMVERKSFNVFIDLLTEKLKTSLYRGWRSTALDCTLGY